MTPSLSRLALLLFVLCGIGIALLILVPTFAWFGPIPGMWGAGPAPFRRAALAPGQEVVGWLLALPPYVAVALGLGQLMAFCHRLRDRRVFSGDAAAALRRFGWSLLAASLLLPLSRASLLVLVGGLADAVHLGLAGATLVMFVALGATFGLVFVVFAAILSEAARLADENAAFV